MTVTLKCQTLLLSDGQSQLFLDFSLHGEEGWKPNKKLILTDKQRSERFSADYTGQIIEKLQKKELTKHNRTLKCTYCTIDVKFAGTAVRLFFSKHGRKGQWNGLHTTNLTLSFLKAYRTYATCWTTEVAYHDQKQLLNFGKYQSVHFSAQIDSFTLTMMQCNILCTLKRFEAYETIGALFRDVTGNTPELSAADRIWELILDTIQEIAEIILPIPANSFLQSLMKTLSFINYIRCKN